MPNKKQQCSTLSGSLGKYHFGPTASREGPDTALWSGSMLSCRSQGSQDIQGKGHPVPSFFPVLLQNFFSPTDASHIQLHLLPTILSSGQVHRLTSKRLVSKAPPLQSPNFFRVGQTRPSLHLKPHPVDPPETWDIRSCKVFHGFSKLLEG